ncbi:hypothetical protein [Aeromicrobium wangtongii]|uniref:Uncharacterized protein n=1 Tax=Aeromicrobium wangtongii TaxID=2969247 RepID=A0ABY5MBY3_9ACTN|nr:hypothetical protein [Aeromicrobium wangtongii]MCD9197856.1 hypothetical protein [Aeromicrobium wangtongii]UUP15337.1 hypothetical protein NQV15_08495 [Aeromicrobium wangtongii]
MPDRRLRRGLPRLVRGGLVALLTMTLGVGAHVWAGGHAPSVTAAGVLVLAFTAACWALSSQRWTARPLLAMFLLAQVGTHTVAVVEHPDASMGMVAMIPAHAAAAALLVVMVTSGERAAIELVEHLALRCLALRAVPAPRPTTARAASRIVSPGAGFLGGPVRGRAPPRGLLLPTS